MQKQAFITVSFRLRTPTRRKQELLDFAMQEYTSQVQRLLDWAHEHLDNIRTNGRTSKGVYNADSIRPCLPTGTAWRVPLSSSLKDGIFSDVCGMIASYLELESTDLLNNWPTAETVVTDEPRARALSAFGTLDTVGRAGALRSGADIAEVADEVALLLDRRRESDLAADMRRKAFVKERPLTYTRGRDFDLLITSDLKHPYIYLPLLPNDDKRTGITDFGQKNMLTLWSNDPDGVTPIQAGKKRNGLLLPLELGKRGGQFHWQFRKFLLAMLDGNGVPKSAKVIKRRGHYYINVSVAFPAPAPYEPKGYMGITDNVLYNLTYAIVGKTGELMQTHQSETGILDLKMDAQKQIRRKQQQGKAVSYLDYRTSAQDELLHLLINQMLQTAKTHGAGIAMMDTNGIYSKRNEKKLKRLWTKAEFIIAYKCKMMGIPYRTGVFPAKAMGICIRCGGDCSRQESNAVCAQCGASVPLGITKAVNIARRVMYRKSEWGTKGGYRGFHQSFR